MSVVQAPMSTAARTDESTPLKTVEGVSLAELIQRARNASGEERAWLAGLVNKALFALSSAPDKERQATSLLAMLDDEALHGLEDDQQVPSRAVAVEALLQIGYPWALQLDPDDVQFLREHPSRARLRVPLARLAGGSAGIGAALMLGVSVVSLKTWWLSQLTSSPSELGLVAGLAAITLSSFSLVLGRPLLKAARWVMGLSSLLVGAVVGWDALQYQPSALHALMLAVPVLGTAAALVRDRTRST